MDLKEIAKTLPTLPGVYKFIDAAGIPIYIGKSKSLRNRVSSYFSNNIKWEKINKMIFFAKDIEYIVCDTHLEARLLECELIKQLKPYFNAQFKSDKGYMYIKIEKYNKNRSLSIVSDREEDTTGPFRHKYSLEQTLIQLSDIFPIVYQNKNYHFEYSLFNNTMDEYSFNQNRESLLRIFSDFNEMNKLIESLNIKMKEAALNEMFESAAKYRDLIYRLNILNNTIWKYTSIANKDCVLMIPVKDGIKYFYASKGIIQSKKTYEDDSYVSTFISNCIKDYDITNEKEYIDYRDIVCSEILTLPDKSIVVI